MESKVYVLNHSGHDLGKAKRYGTLEVLTSGKVNIFSTDRLLHELTQKLKDFNWEEDYVLLSGNNILSFMVARILCALGKPINILVFNFKTSDYVVRSM